MHVDRSFTVIKEQRLADGMRSLFWLQPNSQFSPDSVLKLT